MQRPNPINESRKELAGKIEASSNTEEVRALFDSLGEEVQGKTKQIIEELGRFMDEYREHGEMTRINALLIKNGRVLKTLAEYAGLKERDPKRIAEKFAKGQVSRSDIDMKLLARFQEQELEHAESDTELNEGLAEFEKLKAAYLSYESINDQYSERKKELQRAGAVTATVVGQVLPRIAQQAKELDEKKAALRAIPHPEDASFQLDFETHLKNTARQAQLLRKLDTLEAQRNDHVTDQEVSFASQELLDGNDRTMEKKQMLDKEIQGLDAFCPSLFSMKRIADHNRPALELYGNVKVACETSGASNVRRVLESRLSYARDLSRLLDVMCTTGNTSNERIVKQFSADEIVLTPDKSMENILKTEGVTLSLVNPFKLLSNTKKANYIKTMAQVMRRLVEALEEELKVAKYAGRVQEGTALSADLKPEYLSDEDLEAQIETTTDQLQKVSDSVEKGETILKEHGGQLRWDDIQECLQSGRNNFLMVMEEFAVVVNQHGEVTGYSPQDHLPHGHSLAFNPAVKSFLPPALFAALSSLMTDEQHAPALEGRTADEIAAMLNDLIQSLDPQEMHQSFRAKLEEAQAEVQKAQAAYYQRWALVKGVQVGNDYTENSKAYQAELKRLDEMKRSIYQTLNEARDLVAEITTAIGDRLKNAEEIKRAVTELQTVVT